MKEIQLENVDIDYSDITKVVEEKVFCIGKDITEMNNLDRSVHESIINVNETDTSV